MGGDNYGFKGSLEEQADAIVASETIPAVDTSTATETILEKGDK